MQISSLNSQDLQNDFLTLLVTQLAHQDPLAPTKQEEFIGQLAQFSMVEGIENLNARFEDILYLQQVLNGFDLAGKEVSYVSSETRDTKTGEVSEVFVDNGLIQVRVNKEVVPIQQVTGVHA